MAIGWTTQDLIRVVAAGGSLDLSAARLTAEDAGKLAGFAARSDARITFRGAGKWTAQDALRIAAFGQGKVTFAD